MQIFQSVLTTETNLNMHVDKKKTPVWTASTWTAKLKATGHIRFIHRIIFTGLGAETYGKWLERKLEKVTDIIVHNKSSGQRMKRN